MPWFHMFKLKHFCWETWWSCKPSWSLEVCVSQHQPKHTIHIMKETSIHIKWGCCTRVMEFLYISFHPYVKQKSHQFLRVPKGTSTSTQHPISRANGPYHLCLPSRGGKSGTPFGVKSFDRHQPVISLLDGLEGAVKWHHLAHPFGAALAVELPGLQAPVFYLLVEWSEWSITFTTWIYIRPANQPTEQTKRPTATGVIKVYGFDVQTGRHLYAQV